MPHTLTPVSTKPEPKPKPRLSIRARLILLALLILVPLILDRVRLLEATRAERIETAHAEVLDIARRGVDAQLEVVSSTRAVMQVLARSYVALVKAGQTCSSFLNDFTIDVPWIKAISVAGPNGRIACSTRASAIGLDVSDRKHVEDARRSWNFVLSDYVISRSDQQPTIIAAFPTMAYDERIDAIILAPVDLQWVGRLASAVGKRGGASVFMLDAQGTILGGGPNLDHIVGRNFANQPFVHAILTSAGGTFTAEGFDGRRRIVAVMSLPGTDARLAVSLDEREVLSRIDREVGIAYLQLVLFGLIVLLAAWFGGERLIVEPIRALSRIAARIGRGERDANPGGRAWAAEFAPLAVALDDMAIKLAKREHDLRSANTHLEELASIDALSGLANRRSFNAQLDAEWQHSAKLKRPIGLLMIDVDHFKLFNDNYGHLAGDNCLRTVSEMITAAAARSTDFAARYGGEEFALLLPDATIEKAVEIAEQLRVNVDQLAIVNEGAPTGAVTISIGVASLVPPAAESAQVLIEAADAGLYSAKRRGRNTVVAHGVVELLVAS